MSNPMVEQITAAFENCIPNSCLSTISHTYFKVFDREDQCCYICTDNEPNTLSFFAVKNPKGKELNFLAIDRCLITDEDEKKCDCAIFDEASFNFVEIKTASTGTRGKRRSKAFDQLKRTIGFFKQKVDFEGYELFALICIGCSAIYPRATAAHMGRRMELSRLYQTRLTEGNLIEF